ncbi:MAG: right-handed parallel beta-helix repeat-containing protein [Sandaracinaceae bacterium]
MSRRDFSLLLGSSGLAACTPGLDPLDDAGTVRDARAPQDATSPDAGLEPDSATDASTPAEGLYASRTKTVSPDADGTGDGSDARPWTLTQAMELAVAGDVVGIRPGRYVGRQPQASIDDPSLTNNLPAWAPANDGTADAPIVFVAQFSAAHHDTDRSELHSGASHGAGSRTGWPCFGTRMRTRTSHVKWIGLYADEGDPEGHISQDCGVVTCWNADHITIAECHIVGDPDVSAGDNYSAIRLEGVEDTAIHDNRLEGFWGGGGTNNTGVILYGVDRLRVEHNHFLRCAHGVQPKGAGYGLEMQALTVRLNHFESCVSALRLHRPVANPGGSRSRVQQNLVEGCRYFIELTTSSGVMRVADLDVFNNTIAHGRDGADPGCIWWAAPPDGGDCRVFNNLFFDVDAYLGSYSASAAAIAGFAAYDHNALSFARSAFGGSRALQDMALSEWQSTHGQDRSSLVGDPRVDDAYRLQPDSPCVGAGRDLLGLFGPVDGPVDIGAFVTGGETIGIRTA